MYQMKTIVVTVLECFCSSNCKIGCGSTVLGCYVGLSCYGYGAKLVFFVVREIEVSRFGGLMTAGLKSTFGGCGCSLAAGGSSMINCL